jgi:prevent-host-death family protein
VLVETIPQKQLRNQVGDVLRRVEAGETFTVTVAGRPVAELRPAQRRRWVSGSALSGVWQGPPPQRLDDDLAHLGAALIDLFDP